MLREMKKFGKIGILSNMEVEPEEIYLLYKERKSVEVAFDAFKNELEGDKLYLSDDDKESFTEISAKVEKLDKALGLNLFPKILRS